MKVIKKAKIITYIFTLCTLLALTLSLAVSAAPKIVDIDDAEGEGLFVELMLRSDATTPSEISVSVRYFANDEFVSNVRPVLILPECFRIESGYSGEAFTPEVKKNITHEYVIKYYEPEAPSESEPAPSAPSSTDTEKPSDGCGSTIGAFSVVAVCILVAALMLIKGKKRGLSFMLAIVMLAVPLAITANAESLDKVNGGQRTLEVTCEFEYSGNTYSVQIKVDYEYQYEIIKGEEQQGMDQFEITYYWGPQRYHMTNEEMIKAIAECGFTSVPLENGTIEENKVALSLLEKYGLTCSGLMDQRINQLAGTDRTQSPDVSQEEVDRVVEEVVNDYKDYHHIIKGWWVQDEPEVARFEIVGKIVKAFRKFAPQHVTMVNLYPTYAEDSKLLGTPTYEEYVKLFIEQVDPHYLSYDHYHFMKSGDRLDFFKNLEIIRKEGIENGLAQMLIVLLTEHLKYVNVTKEQIAWEVNMSLTYGMRRVSYFTFFIEESLTANGWTNSCMNHEGHKFQHYYDVQEINQWLLPLGRELQDKTSTAVFHVGKKIPDQTVKYYSFGELGRVEGDNFVIGFFDDDSFMISNKTYKQNTQNSLELLDFSGELEYFETSSSSWKNATANGVAVKNADGRLVIEFEASEGILFRAAK